jgi:hypothetical protein
MVHLQLLEYVPPALKITVDRVSIDINCETKIQQRFHLLVLGRNGGVDLSFIELFQIVVVCHSIVFDLFCIEGN